MDSIKGSFVHLECIVSGSHPISIQWYKDGQEITASEKHKYSFHDNTAFLEINNLEGTDSGSYTCEATNKAGSSQCSGFLTVKGLKPPYFVEKPQSQEVVPNARVQFKALVKGSTPLQIKWFKDSQELLSGASRSVWKDDTSSVLELFSARTSDSGSYTCQISNDVGTATCKATLFVKGVQPNLLIILVLIFKLGCLLSAVYFAYNTSLPNKQKSGSIFPVVQQQSWKEPLNISVMFFCSEREVKIFYILNENIL
uniref:Ig-like domain-containing protein n=1 Tax=Serinus canaria TaxID=9135 RepID=A0A8C9KUB9_SERCA